MINLYRCAANHPDELARKLRELPPASRAQIDQTRQLLQTKGCLTDIQRAALFLHLNKTSFAGTETLIERVRTFQDRFNAVVIEQLDYQRLLKFYDHPDNFIFLDPPYGVSNIRNYDGWTDEQLTGFRDRVITLKSRWIITLDDSPLNRSLWEGYVFDRITTRNGSGNQTLAPARHFGELIIHSPGLRG